jgi:hypothetical protein
MSKMLSQSELKELVKYDPDTGVFTLVKHRHGTTRKIGEELGSFNKGKYLETGINQKRYYLHRLAFLYMTGEIPLGVIDHINGDRSDNRWVNLRCVDHKANAENTSKLRTDSTTGYRGVHRWHGKYRAKINSGGKQIHLGTFETAEQAAEAYQLAKPIYHPNFQQRSN